MNSEDNELIGGDGDDAGGDSGTGENASGGGDTSESSTTGDGSDTSPPPLEETILEKGSDPPEKK